ncbi:3'-5' exonuclease [Ignavibacteriales bacterium]
MRLKLIRPIVFFDLETTGIDVEKDKIVEISLLKLFSDGKREIKTVLVNPERSIPTEASKIHGLYDLMVANEKTFPEIAQNLLKIFDGCDISGYNLLSYDLPLIKQEFRRCGIDFPAKGTVAIDPYLLYAKKEPKNPGNPSDTRRLTDAYQFYCGKKIVGAHSAEADIVATMEVFLAQLEKYSDIGDSPEEIAQYLGAGRTKNADISGKLVFNDRDEIVYNFGKHVGKRVKDEKSYAEWMLKSDFPDDTKRVLREILKK